MKHVTFSWLRKYANINKHASYQDKLEAVLQEKNVYYLLEWLLFPISGEEADAIRFTRSPGKIKNSYIDFTDVFFGQIIYDIAFRANASTKIETLKLESAIHDLRIFYGQEVWNAAVQLWKDKIEIEWTQYEYFVQELAREQRLITDKYQEKLKEIDASHDTETEEKAYQLQMAADLFEQRREEAPRKLLHKKFSQWPLVSYIHYSEWKQPKNHLQWLAEKFLEFEHTSYFVYTQDADYSAFLDWIRSDLEQFKLFAKWFPTYASKTLMNIEYVDTENRQRWWTELLLHLHQNNFEDALTTDMFTLTFDIVGIDQVMMSDRTVPAYFNRLVTLALQDEDHRRWLRETVILRHWTVFIKQFAADSYQYDALSWVLCLDPENLEQKLLRGLQLTKDQSLQHTDLPFIVERCCEIFIDGIRAGLDSQLMVPLFKYLTIHHIDFMYSYIQRIHNPDQLQSIMLLEDSLLQRIFSGNGVRTVASRKRLHPIFLEWFAQKHLGGRELMQLKKLGKVLLPDKGELVQLWLNHLTEELWPQDKADLLAELLEIRWLGKPGADNGQHELVEAWLDHHSEWVLSFFQKSG